MIKIKAKPGIPRIKADGTGTIPLNTIIELNKSIFDYLASANFDKKASIYSNEDE